MKIFEVYNFLDSISPFSMQESWDNSGLNLGSIDSDFYGIYVCLELDDYVLANIKPHSLVICHHPLIFKPIKNFDTNRYPCNLIKKCNSLNISLISLHTNFDKTHLNDYFVSKMKLEDLGFYKLPSDGYEAVMRCDKMQDFYAILNQVQSSMNLDVIRYSVGSKYINTLLITSGSNASSFVNAVYNTVVITGDIKYHDAKMANSQGVSFIDVPHYESEAIFVSLMHEILLSNGIDSLIVHSRNPFDYKGK